MVLVSISSGIWHSFAGGATRGVKVLNWIWMMRGFDCTQKSSDLFFNFCESTRVQNDIWMIAASSSKQRRFVFFRDPFFGPQLRRSKITLTDVFWGYPRWYPTRGFLFSKNFFTSNHVIFLVGLQPNFARFCWIFSASYFSSSPTAIYPP